MPARLIIRLIVFYQKYISPFKAPSCRFYPTCSQYACQCLAKYGVMRGFWMTLKRLCCCHPFHPGGYDPVK